MKKLYEENDIQAIADSIREKNGTQNKYKVSDMSEAVLSIQGSTPYHHEADRLAPNLDPTTPWVRPDDWPDLDALPLPDDGTNCVYLTIDNVNPQQTANYVRFAHEGSCDCFVDYGHVENGQYIVDSTDNGNGTWSSPAHLFTPADGSYPVVRLRSSKATTFRQIAVDAITAANSPNGLAVVKMDTEGFGVLEVVGIIPTMTKLNGTNLSPMYGGRLCRRICLQQCDNVTQMSYTFNNNAVCKSIVLSTKNKKITINGNINYTFVGCNELQTLDLSMISVDGATSIDSIFSYCRSLRSLDITGWNITSKCTLTSTAFRECRVLPFDNIHVEHWDVSKVTTFQNMFEGCFMLKQIDLSEWNPASATNMASMFTKCMTLEKLILPKHAAPNLANLSQFASNCFNLSGQVDVSYLNPTSVQNIYMMFASDTHLEKVNMGNMKVVTNTTSTSAGAVSVFSNCYSLKQIIWDMSNCDFTNSTNIASFYQNCYNLQTPIDWSFFHGNNSTAFAPWKNCYKVPSITLSDEIYMPKLTSFASMFEGCHSIKRADVSGIKSTGTVTTIASMFSNCRSIEEIIMPTFDTSAVTTIATAFGNCASLKKVPDALKTYNLPKCTTMATMFTDDYSLEEIDLSGITNFVPTTTTSAFANCWNLKKINLHGIGGSPSSSNMFTGIAFEYLDQSGMKATAAALLPTTCPVLVEWYPPVIDVACTISIMLSLSDDSLQRIVDSLTKKTAATKITMSSKLSKRLSIQQIAAITGKGWTIA